MRCVNCQRWFVSGEEKIKNGTGFVHANQSMCKGLSQPSEMPRKESVDPLSITAENYCNSTIGKRQSQNEEVTEMASSILRGNIKCCPNLLKFIPKAKLEVFISSTFTDTHFERNILHEIILPDLQKKYREFGLQILFSDLRFGIKDESSDAHEVWELCEQEITRCFRESNGLFFLSLQGDKYGYRSLPKFLDETKFTDIFARLSLDHQLILSRWYERNENQVSTQFELVHLTDENKALFWQDSSILREVVLNGFTIQCNECILKVNRSVTEWETRLALSLSADSCYWMHRTLNFPRNLNGVEISSYKDLNSNDGKRLITELKSEMNFKLKGNVHNISVAFEDYQKMLKDRDKNGMVDPTNHYYLAWRNTIDEMLRKELDRIVLERRQWEAHGFSFPIPGGYVEEMFHHIKIAYEKSKNFIGRKDLIKECEKIIDIGVPLYDRFQFRSISLSLIGKSGSGKTALMSVLASKYHDRYNSNIPVIIRFCGTSKLSIHARDLIQSIVMQILLVYNEINLLSKFLIECQHQTFAQALDEFRSILKKFPAILFIDSLDQLSNRDEARSRLSFLRDLPQHSRSKLIVSCLPDEFDEIQNKWIYCYFCDTRLLEANVPRIMIPSFAPDKEDGSMNENAVSRLLNDLLALKNRKITTNQMNIAVKSILHEPTILYFNLALKVICEWNSNLVTPALAPGVIELVNQIFDKIEKKYGKFLVSAAFSFITFSRAGINDIEMQDLLSLDDYVLHEVFQYAEKTKIKRVPIHVWLRLKSEIKELIAEKHFNCISWYHRQIWETAERRYNFDKVRYHRIMGKYFTNLVEASVIEERLISRQPLTLNNVSIWLSTAKINERRVIESAYNLLKANMFAEVVDLHFCNFEMIYASTLIHDGFFLVTLFTELKQLLLQNNPINPLLTEQISKLNHYYSWLSKEMGSIQRDPKQQLFGTARNEPLLSCVRNDLRITLQHLRNLQSQQNQQEENQNVYFDLITLNGKDAFQPVLLNGKDHSDFLKSLCWNPNDSFIATASADKTVKIWNSMTGEVLHTLASHHSFVTFIAWHPLKPILASCSLDCSIKIWDTVTGRLIKNIEGFETVTEKYSKVPKGDRLIETVPFFRPDLEKDFTFDGHHQGVQCLSWSGNGLFLITSGNDSLIKIWEVSTWKLLCTLNNNSKVEYVSSANTNSLFATRTSKSIFIWSFDNPTSPPIQLQELRDINTIIDEKRNSLAWSPNDSMITSGCNDGVIKIWKLVGKTLEIMKTLNGGHSKGTHIYSLCWIHQKNSTSELDRLASGGDDRQILIWNYLNGQVLHRYRSHLDSITGLACNHQGNILASVSYDKTLKLWDLSIVDHLDDLHQEEMNEDDNRMNGQIDQIFSVGYFNDPTRLYSISKDGALIEWDIPTNNPIHKLQVKQHGFSDYILAAVPTLWSKLNHENQKKIFAYALNESIILWDIHLQERISALYLPPSRIAYKREVKQISWNSNLTMICGVVTGMFHDEIITWQLSLIFAEQRPHPSSLNYFNGTYPMDHKHPGNFIQWHPSQSQIAVIIHKNVLEIMNMETWKVINSCNSTISWQSVVWNKAGDQLAVSNTHGEISILSSSTFKTIQQFQELSSSASSSSVISHGAYGEIFMDWNFQGNHLVSTTNWINQNYLCLWNVLDGALLTRLYSHEGVVTSVLWIDDHRLVSTSKDCTIKIWEMY